MAERELGTFEVSGSNPDCGSHDTVLATWQQAAYRQDISTCLCGVIGSRAGLRSQCRKTCRFESDQGYALRSIVKVVG